MAKIGVYSESLAISKEGRLYVGMNNLVTVYDAETLREVMKINLLNNTSWLVTVAVLLQLVTLIKWSFLYTSMIMSLKKTCSARI